MKIKFGGKFYILVLFLLVFLSRALLLSKSPAFFDSREYLRLAQNPSVVEVFRQAHLPIHPLYILQNWLITKIPLAIKNIYRLELLNAFWGTLCVCVIYSLLKEFINQKKALYLSLLAAFLPYFWLSQVNILYEPLLVFFQLISFFFLVRYIKEGKFRDLFLSGVGAYFSFLVSTSTLFFLSLMVIFVFLKNKSKFIAAGVLFLIFLFIGLLTYFYIMNLRDISLQNFLDVFTSSNDIFVKIKNEGILFLPRLIRNSFVVYTNYLTLPLSVYLFVLLIKELNNLKKNSLTIIILLISWVVLFLGINTYWHAGMFGRTSLIFTLFPLLLLIKSPFLDKKLYYFPLLLYLFVTSFLKVFPYYLGETPYVKEENYLREIDNRILIVSNYEEPYLCQETKCFLLNSPLTQPQDILLKTKNLVNNGEKVYITSQAITAPYKQYDGMQYHMLSKRNNYPKTAGEELVANFQLKLVKQWPEENLKVFEIQDK